MRHLTGYTSSLRTSVPALPKETAEPSPAGHSWRGAPCLSDYAQLGPRREVANGDAGATRIHAPFPATDFAQCKMKLGRLPKGLSNCTSEFQALRMCFHLTWRDTQIVLAICCTPEENHDSQLPSSSQPVGTAVIPNQDLACNYQLGQEDCIKRDHPVLCPIEGRKEAGGLAFPATPQPPPTASPGIGQHSLFAGPRPLKADNQASSAQRPFLSSSWHSGQVTACACGTTHALPHVRRGVSSLRVQ